MGGKRGIQSVGHSTAPLEAGQPITAGRLSKKPLQAPRAIYVDPWTDLIYSGKSLNQMPPFKESSCLRKQFSLGRDYALNSLRLQCPWRIPELLFRMTTKTYLSSQAAASNGCSFAPSQSQRKLLFKMDKSERMPIILKSQWSQEGADKIETLTRKPRQEFGTISKESNPAFYLLPRDLLPRFQHQNNSHRVHRHDVVLGSYEMSARSGS